MSHPCNSQVKFQLLNVFIREKKSRLDKVASQKTEVGFNSPISCLSLVPMSQIRIPQCVSQSPHVGVVPKLLSVRVRKKNHVKILSTSPLSSPRTVPSPWDLAWVSSSSYVRVRAISRCLNALSPSHHCGHTKRVLKLEWELESSGSRPSSHEPQSLLRSSQSSCHVWGSSIKSKNETPDCLKLFTREHI